MKWRNYDGQLRKISSNEEINIYQQLIKSILRTNQNEESKNWSNPILDWIIGRSRIRKYWYLESYA